MESKKNNMFNAVLKKEGNKLVYQNQFDNALYSEFVKSLGKGQFVEIFLDANRDDGTLAQLAKIHKCIRELCFHTGYTFEDMKLEVKHKAGLCVTKDLGGEHYVVCKSFSKCSRDELGLAIEAIVELGDFNGMNFR